MSNIFSQLIASRALICKRGIYRKAVNVGGLARDLIDSKYPRDQTMTQTQIFVTNCVNKGNKCEVIRVHGNTYHRVKCSLSQMKLAQHLAVLVIIINHYKADLMLQKCIITL